MKKFLLYIACVFIPVLTGVAITNYVVDPGEVYSSQSVDKIINGNSKNLNVTNVPDNINDREYKKRLCELYRGKSFDYLVLGHSRSLSISTGMIPNSSILNLWVTNGTLMDYIALYEICKENNISYKHVLLCADPPSLFNANYDNKKWMTFSDYYYKFFDKEKPFNIDFSLFENLFSFSYFQVALKDEEKKEMTYVTTPINDGNTYRNDGSRSYKKEWRDKPQKETDKLAQTEKPPMFSDFNDLSEKKMIIFDSLIHAIHKNGADVLFFCPPYHPIFHERIKNIKGMQDGIKYIEKYAHDHHIRMIGHFNEGNEGFTNFDFYDQVHPRREAVERLLNLYLN